MVAIRQVLSSSESLDKSAFISETKSWHEILVHFRRFEVQLYEERRANS